jgi:transposase
MAYQTKHIDKKTGAIYVYSVESYWDKELKESRNKQVCLGRLNEATGEIIPSGRKKRTIKRAVAAKDAEPGITARAKTIGPYMLMDKIAEESGLSSVCKKCFNDGAVDVLSLTYFIVHKGLPLSRIEGWSETCEHPGGGYISSQRVSNLLCDMDEEIRSRFFSLWMKKLSESECFCYDITSISSYARGNEYVRWGYNRDHDSLPQINLAMLFGQQSGLPAYFRRLPGFISDVSTLKTTMKSLDFLGQKKLTFILDRGFYSEANLDELLRAKYHFILAPPTGRKWVKAIIDKHYESIKLPDCYRKCDNGEPLFMTTHPHSHKGRRCYLHIFFNAHSAADEHDGFIGKLLDWKEELESGNIKEQNEEYYKEFFVVKQTPKRGRNVTFNNVAIAKHKNRYAGFFCLLSTKKMQAEEALRLYRNKDVVENCFDDLKNSLDMKRLRVHSSKAMDSRLFVQFMALILLSGIRKIIRANDKLKRMSVREVLEAMEPIVRMRFSGRYGEVVSEVGPLQREIMNAFGLHLNS